MLAGLEEARADLDDWAGAFLLEFEGVADQVLEKLAHLQRVGLDHRERRGGEVAALAEKILATIAKEPLYYTDIAERFGSGTLRLTAALLVYSRRLYL